MVIWFISGLSFAIILAVSSLDVSNSFMINLTKAVGVE